MHAVPSAMHAELSMQVEQLLQQGADAAYQDEETGCSCLMQAAKHGCLSHVKQLLAAGAPWNAVDRQGLCAGDHAIARGHEDTATALLDAGQHTHLPCYASSRTNALDMQHLSCGGFCPGLQGTSPRLSLRSARE